MAPPADTDPRPLRPPAPASRVDEIDVQASEPALEEPDAPSSPSRRSTEDSRPWLARAKELVAETYEDHVRGLLPSGSHLERGRTLTGGPIVSSCRRKPLDRFFPTVMGDDPLKEAGLIAGHHAVTQRGDHVVIVGGGAGKTAVAAARQVGPSGRVTVYDGHDGQDHHKFGIENIAATLELNDVREVCELNHGLVGTQAHVPGDVPEPGEGGPDVMHPAQLPMCDVLEFDCNGSELDILRNLDVRPRAMIVEIEALFYKRMYGGDAHPRDTLREIRNLGYRIVQQTGHRGRAVTFDELLELVDRGYEAEQSVEIDNGAVDSPIVVAVREDLHNPPVSPRGASGA